MVSQLIKQTINSTLKIRFNHIHLMQIPIYIINAFTDGLFTGNPAAVCPLDTWIPDNTMQQIAAQNNLSETAFIVKDKDHFNIRWFTPTIEVPLCGHATLAAAYVLFYKLEHHQTYIQFQSKSGEIIVTRDGEILTLNFPTATLEDVPYPPILKNAFSYQAKSWTRNSTFFLIELNTEDEVRTIEPNLEVLNQVQAAGVIFTAKSTKVDFVSRVFAPQSGIDEDPVTGSAHCLLIPYWAQKLNKTTMIAKQLSKRGGLLFCTHADDRVLIGGKAELFLQGMIEF
jgi:PhzF family phenazine biosynthesis protein